MASSSVTSALVTVPCGQYPPLPISIHGSLPQPMREQLSYNQTPKLVYPCIHWTVKSVSTFLLLILNVNSSQVPVDPWSIYSAPSTCSHTSTTSSNGYRYSTILQTWSQQPSPSSTTPLQSSTPEVFHQMILTDLEPLLFKKQYKTKELLKTYSLIIDFHL